MKLSISVLLLTALIASPSHAKDKTGCPEGYTCYTMPAGDVAAWLKTPEGIGVTQRAEEQKRIEAENRALRIQRNQRYDLEDAEDRIDRLEQTLDLDGI